MNTDPDKHWLTKLRDINPIPLKISWINLLPFLLWGIWINRNNNNFNNTHFSPRIKDISNLASEFLFFNSTGTTTKDKSSINIKWYPPQHDWYKLNTDGAFKHEGNKSGIGGAFRNNKGRWILGYQKMDKAISPLHAELQAIHEGMKIAIQYNLFPLEIETDSTDAIHALNNDHLVMANIIHACRLLMLQRKDLSLRHNFREGNQVAHLLATDANKLATMQEVSKTTSNTTPC
ncbi:PREDICTED: uncharacterized protein LOC109237091 [Nicotiana attenuata]|uniref:uncharacterized protein LOC109237091 n=1 Tax=Nicotiana attenuata TaxID=49451 RepID=UPI000905834F|nr:PREDICTED: uncharacterized protein LOC109237091 [Nicotiana attenuata]